MKYHLQPLDELIGNYGEVDNEDVGKIIDQIRQTAYSLHTEEQVRLYIRNHQIALLAKKKHETVSSKCDTILFFLETKFGSFLNETLPISDLGKEKLCTQCMPIIEAAVSNLKILVSRKLFITMQPLLEPDCSNNYTIYCAGYIAQFWQNWENDFVKSRDRYEEDDIINFLISQNFNSPLFFEVVTGYIIGELHQEDDPIIQRQVLESHAKRLTLLPVRIGNPYRHDFPFINVLLEKWLAIEMKQCRKKVKAYDPQQQSISPKSVPKLETNLSVAQIAYLFKILNQSGIIINKTQMDMLQAVTKSFSTKKTDNIALESLHNKYYNVEDKTKESVKELLEKIIKQME